MSPLDGQSSGNIAEAWNGVVPSKYHVDAAIVALNLLDHPLLHREASLWDDRAFVAVKRSAASLYPGPDSKVAHLSLFSAAGERLLARAGEILADEGYSVLVVGQDSGHFLPGAPTDIPWMGSILRRKGFEPGGLAFDLEGDLSELPMEDVPRGYDFRVVRESELPSLELFFAREFPGRWRYDVLSKIKAEGPATVFGLFDSRECKGFALLQMEGSKRPIGGAVWQADLGPGWGSLGPIGISTDVRGAGLGRSFLNRALIELRSRGVRRAIIDWTSLIDFYGTQGFSVNRAYRSYRLNLRVDPLPGA